MDIKRNGRTMATQKLTPVILPGLDLTEGVIAAKTGLPSEFCEKIISIACHQINWMIGWLGDCDETNN